MKTPLDTRGSRANDGRSARLGKKQPDGTHAHRIAQPAGRYGAGGPTSRGPAPDAGALVVIVDRYLAVDEVAVHDLVPAGPVRA